jgi:hypothetical protein
MSPTIPSEPKTRLKEPKNRPSASTARRWSRPLTERWAKARTAKNIPSTATGFHSSSDSQGATPSAEIIPEMAIAGWK